MRYGLAPRGLFERCGGVGHGPLAWGRPFSSSKFTVSGHPASGIHNANRFDAKPNSRMWGGWGAACRRSRAARWLAANFTSLATYQLILEVALTGILASALHTRALTAEGVESTLLAYHYPFTGSIARSEGVYTESFSIGPFKLSPELLNALRTGHNIANELLPIQILFLAATYHPLRQTCRVLRSRWKGGAGATTTIAKGPGKVGGVGTPWKVPRASIHRSPITTSTKHLKK
ncbi:unnamed protein product [Phytomonas sp. EM1]|nr:unnamed protein product [Phytomonas sp. EM1]|eukprot:CCW63806.1 unnamed protein product [Phytomonas sp. isolate EM1]